MPRKPDLMCFATGKPYMKQARSGTSKSGKKYWNCALSVFDHIDADGNPQYNWVPFTLWEKQIEMVNNLNDKTKIRIGGKPEIIKYYDFEKFDYVEKIGYKWVYSLTVLDD